MLGGFLLLGQVGAALDLDPVLLDVSPFTHTPRLPGRDVGASGALDLVVLLIAAGLLTTVGLGGLRRRDLPQ